MRTEWTVGSPLAAVPRQSREAIREQVRKSIEQARIDAAQAREQARIAVEEARLAQSGGGTGVGGIPPVPPVPGSPQSPDAERVIVTGDGRTVILHPDGSVDVQGGPGDAQVVVPPDGPFGPNGPFGPDGPRIPVEAVVISIAFFVMIAVIAVGIPIARAFGRRIDRRSAALPELADVGQRLDRIEQAIETVAVEVERISEGQRYTARLMSELQAARIPAGESGR